MNNEIGGEYWLDSLTTNGDSPIPKWLSKHGSLQLTTSGRGAISYLLQQIKPRHKSVMLPAYICDSVIAPFKEYGYNILCYNIDEHLIPVNLERIMNAKIGVLLHMGFFGFNTNHILREIICKMKSSGVIVIEDITHTLFTIQTKDLANDYVIASIRKWFGVPSGGFVASNGRLFVSRLDADHHFVTARMKHLQQKARYLESGDISLKNSFLLGLQEAESMLNHDPAPYRIDNLSLGIIANMPPDDLKNKRQQNYCFLLSELESIPTIDIIFQKLDAETVPFFFPILVRGDRNALRDYLKEQRIYCPVHWPIPPQIKSQLSSSTYYVYNHILSIPCDQRYGIQEMKRIADTIKIFVERELQYA